MKISAIGDFINSFKSDFEWSQVHSKSEGRTLNIKRKRWDDLDLE